MMELKEAINVKNTLSDAILELGRQDDRICFLEADLMRATGSDPFAQEFPNRHFQVGIAEQDMMGTAAGLAAMGKIPFAATFASFISQRSCDQAVNAVAYNSFNVKIIGTYCGLSSEKNGGTHIGVEDIAIYRGMPGVTVMCPGDCVEMKQAFFAAAKHEGPVYMRIPRGPMQTYNAADYQFEIGKAVTLRDGNDIAVITTGITTAEGIKAANELEKQGIGVMHIHMPTIKPIDKQAIIQAAEKTGKIITVENHSVIGGLGSAVTEVVCEHASAKVVRLGMQDTFGETATLGYLMEKYGIDAEAIVGAVKKEV